MLSEWRKLPVETLHLLQGSPTRTCRCSQPLVGEGVSVHRSALLPAPTEKPDGRKMDFLLSHLRDRTPLEIATFYNSATDDERLSMEEASRSVGRMPMKTPGGLVWQPLLDPETVPKP